MSIDDRAKQLEDQIREFFHEDLERQRCVIAILRKRVEAARIRTLKFQRAIDKLTPLSDETPYITAHRVSGDFSITDEFLKQFDSVMVCFLVTTSPTEQQLVAVWKSKVAHDAVAPAYETKRGRNEPGDCCGFISDAGRASPKLSGRTLEFAKRHWFATLVFVAGCASLLSQIDTMVEFVAAYVAPATVKIHNVRTMNRSVGRVQIPIVLENHSVFGTAIPTIREVQVLDINNNVVSTTGFEVIKPTGLQKFIKPRERESLIVHAIAREPGVYRLKFEGSSTPKFSWKRADFEGACVQQVEVWPSWEVKFLEANPLPDPKKCIMQMKVRLGADYPYGLQGKITLSGFPNIRIYGTSIEYDEPYPKPNLQKLLSFTSIKWSTKTHHAKYTEFKFNVKIEAVDDSARTQQEWEAIGQALKNSTVTPLEKQE